MAEQARILVVDDEPAVQNALSRAFTLERYEVEDDQLQSTLAFEDLRLDGLPTRLGAVSAECPRAWSGPWAT